MNHTLKTGPGSGAVSNRRSRKASTNRSKKNQIKHLTWIGWIAAVILLVFLSYKLISGPGIYGPDAERGLRPKAPDGKTASRIANAAPETGATDPSGEIASSENAGAGEKSADPSQTLIRRLAEPMSGAFAALESSGAFSLAPPPTSERTPEHSVTVLALGDNLMHNTVMWSGQTPYGYDFRPLYRYIREDVEAADIACIDQETIFINDPNEFTNYPAFGGPVEIGEALADTGFDVILHATNHCYDKFTTGLEDTLAFWRRHPEITVLGIHESEEDARRIRVVEKNGIRVAMLNYTYGTNVGGVPEPWMIDYLADEDKIADDIARAKEISDFVLVFPHWGSENTFEPDEFQKKWGQFFADHGVGAVIGGHTHTLQPVEVLTGREGNEMPVYWSLGNFVSDMASNWNMLGGMALLTISRDSYGVYVSDYSLVPTMTYDSHAGGVWQFFGMRLSDYTDVLAATHRRPNTSVAEMWALYRRIFPEAEEP